VRAASLHFVRLQLVRKISGFNKPSQTNEATFLAVVDEIAGVSARLIHSLETTAPPKNREELAARAKARQKDLVLESVAQLSYPSRSQPRTAGPASAWEGNYLADFLTNV
jgi:hypothetical protein